MRTPLVLSLLLALGATPAAAQRAILLVGVGDAETGAFVEGVDVQVKGLGRRARTDAMGQARIASLPSGTYTIEARRVGYEPLSATVLLADRDSTDVVMMMLPAPTRLPTVAVKETPTEVNVAEFEALRTQGQGRFVSVAETAGDRDYTFESFLVTYMPAMRLHTMVGHTTVRMVRGQGCQPLVYLDGTLLADGDVTGIATNRLAALAYFESAQIPPRYRKGGSGGPSLQNPLKYDGPPKTGLEGEKHASPGGDPACGALLMWSR